MATQAVARPRPSAFRSVRALLASPMAPFYLVLGSVTVLVGLGLGLEGTPLRAAVVLAALPTAQVVFVHAVRYQVGIRLVQATTLWSMLLSIPVIVAAGTLLG